MIETYGRPAIRNRFYDYGSNPFNHDLVDELQAPLSGLKVQALVQEEYDNLPDNGWPTFVVSWKRGGERGGEREIERERMCVLICLTTTGHPSR